MFKQAQKHLSDISCSELAATPPIFFGAKPGGKEKGCQFFILLICRSATSAYNFALNSALHGYWGPASLKTPNRDSD